ncbi:MAG: hypothetical protein U1C52_00655 [Patescibacteria group bacterium]|nr:hypothetical protein [Patescibacteria group bacterium]
MKNINLREEVWGVPAWQWLTVVVVAATLLIAGSNQTNLRQPRVSELSDASDLESRVLPEEGFILPVVWGDLGKQLVAVGAIDAERFESVYQPGGGLSNAEHELLYGVTDEKLVINRDNAHVLLNLFWALGLANENPVLEDGPMQDPQYGGAGFFASTGGWTLAVGDAMDHYSSHSLVVLSSDQQLLVEEVSQNIYRPCCDNPTYFPDCNHGMAMLGLLELMASQGASETEMYEAALRVNSYWFPDTYLTIASYLSQQGKSWEGADPKELLGFDYSSASGFNRVLTEVDPVSSSGGGSCGV